MIFHDPTTFLNTYKGGESESGRSRGYDHSRFSYIGAYQQTTSGLAKTNQDCYELQTGCYSVYGFEYKPGFDDGYITWINDGKRSWTIKGPGMKADPLTEISARPVPQEPMVCEFGTSEMIQLIVVLSVSYRQLGILDELCPY